MPSDRDTASTVADAIRSLPRATELAGALARFGFHETLAEIGLGGWVGRRGQAEVDGSVAARVRMLLEHLGPTFVKLGQIASTRGDLFPDEWIQELAKLRSGVEPIGWEGDGGIQEVLQRELGEKILSERFRSISEAPLAAASIGQVHRAELADGRQAVVKVLRPGVRETLESDMQLFSVLAGVFQGPLAARGMDAEGVIEEFAAQLKRETDLRIEARSTQRLRDGFASFDGAGFPWVEEDLARPSVLVMEFVEGELLTDFAENTPEDRAAEREGVARHAADAVFKQCFEMGFFHADPHPGNIFVRSDGSLCFIDCGMTGLLDPRSREQLAALVYGVVKADLRRVVNVCIEMSGAPGTLRDNREFRQAVWRFMDRFQGETLGSLGMGSLLQDFFELLRTYKLQCPPDVLYLIKAIVTIEGVASDLAPGLNVVERVRPHVEQLMRNAVSVSTLKDRAESMAFEYGALLEKTPLAAADLLDTLRNDKLTINIKHEGSKELTERIEHASANISWALGIAALIVGSSILVLADSVGGSRTLITWIALGGFVAAVALAIGRISLSAAGRQWARLRKKRSSD